MKYSDVYKVVIMEGCKTSSNVWCKFIKADTSDDIRKYVANSDCEIVYIARLTDIDTEFVDTAIDELINSEMVYNS